MDLNKPISEAISSVEETPSSPVVQAPEKGSSKAFVIIVSILLLLIVGMGGYYVYTQYFGPEEVEQVQEEEEEAETLTKEYYNEEFGVKFDYPKDWIVEEEVGVDTALWLQIKEREENPEFIFKYTYHASIGLNYCYYDADTFESTLEGDLFTEYIEIGDEKLLRRSFVEEESKYIVCSLDDYTDKYGIWLNDGIIEYIVNMEREDAEEIIETMDLITLSFEYTGGDSNTEN